jgi:hypothetical protein
MAKRKMSGGKMPIQQVLGVLAGAVAANLAGQLVTKLMPDANNTIKGLIPVGLGVFLAMQKNEIVKGAGFGMVAKGGGDLVAGMLPSITGIDTDELFLSEYYDDGLGLPADQSILSLPADQSILSGMDDDGLFGDDDGLFGDDDGMFGDDDGIFGDDEE